MRNTVRTVPKVLNLGLGEERNKVPGTSFGRIGIRIRDVMRCGIMDGIRDGTRD